MHLPCVFYHLLKTVQSYLNNMNRLLQLLLFGIFLLQVTVTKTNCTTLRLSHAAPFFSIQVSFMIAGSLYESTFLAGFHMVDTDPAGCGLFRPLDSSPESPFQLLVVFLKRELPGPRPQSILSSIKLRSLSLSAPGLRCTVVTFCVWPYPPVGSSHI